MSGHAETGGYGSDPTTQHEFLDAAKAFNWSEVHRMLEAKPDLVNVQPAGRWSAIHQAALSGNDTEVKYLLQRNADPRLVTSEGKMPHEVTTDTDIVTILQEALQGTRRRRQRRNRAAAVADVQEAPRSFDVRFAECVGRSPIVGLRDVRQAVTSNTAPRVQASLVRYQATIADAHGTETAAAVMAAMQEKPIEEVPRSGIRLYTEETWVYSAVNRAFRTHDETALDLEPFSRLLHDHLSEPSPGLPRFTGRCWRWLELKPEVLDQYKVHEDELRNIFSFAGFTSVCTSGEKTWANFENLPVAANTLFCITQADR